MKSLSIEESIELLKESNMSVKPNSWVIEQLKSVEVEGFVHTLAADTVHYFSAEGFDGELRISESGRSNVLSYDAWVRVNGRDTRSSSTLPAFFWKKTSYSGEESRVSLWIKRTMKKLLTEAGRE